MTHALEYEIENNFNYFVRNLSEFVEAHRGQFALLRNASVIGFHDSVREAEASGARKFSDGVFSIQEVNDEPVDLGFFTYAVDNRNAQ